MKTRALTLYIFQVMNHLSVLDRPPKVKIKYTTAQQTRDINQMLVQCWPTVCLRWGFQYVNNRNCSCTLLTFQVIDN